VDHASGKIFNVCQYSTNANKTISSKQQLESKANQEGKESKKYHADDGIFVSKAFKEECDLKEQGYSFSGVGVHHQNGVAKWNIKTIVNWA
jgi:hypothetical protein